MLPSPPESHNDPVQHNATTTKRKPIRRDAEKRRQQNIIAQKRYREKLKRRLGQLERLEAENEQSDEPVAEIPPNAILSPPIDMISMDSSKNNSTSCEDTLIDSHTHAEVSHESNHMTDLSTDTTLWDANLIDDSLLLLGYPLTSVSIKHVDCGCKGPHLELVSSNGAKEYRYSPQYRGDHSQPSLNLPAKSLCIERHCMIQAMFSNCQHIGISEGMICSDEAFSPFFRPMPNKSVCDTTILPSGIVSRVQNIFHTLKPDLRPLQEQITIRHHPVIDVLPFPTFRRNLIITYPPIPEDELFADLLDGLICWSGVGGSKKERSMLEGENSSGTPWDCRSWEARVWFLQKYWTLLGGEEGELVRQSEWWRTLRGEEEEIWPLGGLVTV